ncbi:MAG: YqaJ viral recombinase family protein [Paucibacter sp.]|nr:YqaJ viral recombinase family protein [Roseateles sp.]
MVIRSRKPARMPDRKRFIGGSDVAAVLGLSPWSTPVELWMEKTGRTEPRPVDIKRERIFARGKKLEPVVIDMGIDKLRERGHTVELIARNRRYRHPLHRFISVEIDAELIIDGEHVNVDAKTVMGFARDKWGEEDTEEVPMEYAAQFMTGLACTGRQRCLVLALIGLDDVLIYWVNHDAEAVDSLVGELVDFWVKHVKADAPPDPLRFSDVKALYPRDNGRTVEATPEIAELVEKRRRIGIEIRMLEAEKEQLNCEIGHYLEPFSRLTKGGQQIATFNAQQETSLDVAALRRQHPDLYALYERTQTTRVLRISKPRR